MFVYVNIIPTGMNGSYKQIECSNCFTTSTPLWRRNEQGEHICNACGLYYKIHKSRRPISLKIEGFRHRIRVKKFNENKMFEDKVWQIIPEKMDYYPKKKRLYNAGILEYIYDGSDFHNFKAKNHGKDQNDCFYVKKTKDLIADCNLQSQINSKNFEYSHKKENKEFSIKFYPKNSKFHKYDTMNEIHLKKDLDTNKIESCDGDEQQDQYNTYENIFFEKENDHHVKIKNNKDEIPNIILPITNYSDKKSVNTLENDSTKFFVQLEDFNLKDDMNDKDVNINKKNDAKLMKEFLSEEELMSSKTLHPGILHLEKYKQNIIRSREYNHRENKAVQNSLYRFEEKDSNIHFLEKRFSKRSNEEEDSRFKYKNFNNKKSETIEDEDERMAVIALLSFRKE
ncbi:GATA-binding transcription factor [Spraguea lophii 42_110]|uniref:GATA-binding transcription factor n=1 Tax=Spraguea lophii (strain 42_110) TaxID=1358809 RepID=S7XL89_SPRLO|nr:GATA-binding transcription factor [Spraguea lophii 42_110]